MLRKTFLGTAFLLTLSSCGEIDAGELTPLLNNLDVFDLLGRDDETEAATEASAEPTPRPLVNPNQLTTITDSRNLVQSVDSLTFDPSSSGAIVRATGTAPSQGYFNAQLVNGGISNGVLTLHFRAQAPAGGRPEGSARSRQISAAYVLSTADLATIRSVRVESATNTRSSAF